jgi:hypothetical protein
MLSISPYDWRPEVYTRILTEDERKKIKSYLRTDGKRDATIRKIVSRARRYRGQIMLDFRLLEELVGRYEQTRKVLQLRVRR